jgi:hypothetical protein
MYWGKGSDGSAEDAYSFMAPDPTLAFGGGGSVLPYTRLCICFLDYDYV